MANRKTGRNKVPSSTGGASSRLLSGFGDPNDTAIEEANWDEANPAQIARLIVAVVTFGGAVMFGRSRDSAVLSITVFLDGDKRTRWVRPEEDPDTVIETLVQPFEAME